MSDTPPAELPAERSTVELRAVEAGAAETGASGAAAPVDAGPAPVTFQGPGLFESLLWLCGLFPVQIAGATGMVLCLFLAHAAGHGKLLDLNTNMQLIEHNMLLLMGGVATGTMLYGLAAVMFRLRPQGLRRLGLKLPSPTHLLLVPLLMLPISVLCTEIQKMLFELMPWSRTQMAELFDGVSEGGLGSLVMVMAVLPALGEELIFRGLIGRGLLARWGVVAGVLWTSVLFGVVHLNPAQAIAVIPMGVVLHYVYLTTGSFWAPVLLHFLNNAFAAVMLKHGEQLLLGRVMDGDGPVPLELLVVSCTVATAVLSLLWQTRVRYVPAPLPMDGVPFPLDANLALFQGDAGTMAVIERPQPLVLMGGTFCLLGFIAVVLRITLWA